MAADIEDKIAKLLARAEGTTNAHEAEAFMAQAEKLMIKFGVDRANLEAKDSVNKQDNIITIRVPVPDGHGYATAMVMIAHNIAPSFSVRTLQSSMGTTRIVWFIGHSSDVEDTIRLFNSLMVQSRSQAVAWWRNEGKHNTVWYTDNDAYLARREFIFAFARGAGSRLAETRNTIVAEASAGTELVLVDRAKAVDRWIDNNLKVGKGRATSRRTGGEQARSAGYRSGRDAISGKAINGK